MIARSSGPRPSRRYRRPPREIRLAHALQHPPHAVLGEVPRDEQDPLFHLGRAPRARSWIAPARKACRRPWSIERRETAACCRGRCGADRRAPGLTAPRSPSPARCRRRTRRRHAALSRLREHVRRKVSDMPRRISPRCSMWLGPAPAWIDAVIEQPYGVRPMRRVAEERAPRAGRVPAVHPHHFGRRPADEQIDVAEGTDQVETLGEEMARPGQRPTPARDRGLRHRIRRPPQRRPGDPGGASGSSAGGRPAPRSTRAAESRAASGKARSTNPAAPARARPHPARGAALDQQHARRASVRRATAARLSEVTSHEAGQLGRRRAASPGRPDRHARRARAPLRSPRACRPARSPVPSAASARRILRHREQAPSRARPCRRSPSPAARRAPRPRTGRRRARPRRPRRRLDRREPSGAAAASRHRLPPSFTTDRRGRNHDCRAACPSALPLDRVTLDRDGPTMPSWSRALPPRRLAPRADARAASPRSARPASRQAARARHRSSSRMPSVMRS